jgi:hypothetical protein
VRGQGGSGEYSYEAVIKLRPWKNTCAGRATE